MVEALLYDRLPERAVRCNICQRRCEIPESKRGYCLTRLNRGGTLYTLIYGEVSTLMVSPIEKKPMFHFYPGSPWLSLGSLGCNFRCPGCQNWEIAHSRVGQEYPDAQIEAQDISTGRGTEYVSPEQMVGLAEDYKCRGISWTYNEPTLWFEYTLKGAKLARGKGLLTNYVTNGYITPEALDLIGPYLDSYRVDIKGFSRSAYRRIAHINGFEGILEVAKRAKQRWGMHLEIVTNIIPGYNDSKPQLKRIASWIKKELGEDVPWHVTRFVPHLKLSHLEPTPVTTLEGAREIGLEQGLRYVYLGNVPGHPGENTCCYQCKSLLIERSVFSIVENRLDNSRCPECGARIAGIFS
ncbi:MAG: AmmeMemoRadiSam system radical SAM enzyme [Deltaproteobacteria bacterium]|nr:MAG: AmmeMemoRadiSam system radical SAM enzyme [Deltaproteobacteria bacterium]